MRTSYRAIAQGFIKIGSKHENSSNLYKSVCNSVLDQALQKHPAVRENKIGVRTES